MRISFFFWVIFISLPTLGQISPGTVTEDSIEYEIDTVLVYKPPIIITKRIYISRPLPSHHWSAEIFISPFTYSNKFKSTSQAHLSEADRLSHAVSPLLSYSGGLQVNCHKKNILFSLGVQYSAFRENYSQVDSRPTITIYSQPDTLSSYTEIVNGKDTVMYVIDEKTTIDSIFKQTSAVLTHHYLNTSLMAGYEINKNRVILSVRGGLLLGIYLFSNKGKIPANTEFSSISKWNVGYTLRAGIVYALSKQIGILAEGNFNADLSPIHVNSGIDQRRIWAGLRFGIRFTLNK